MNLKPLILGTALFTLSACSNAAEAPAPASSAAIAKTASGSVLLELRGETIPAGNNPAQCQVQVRATNRSAAPIKSLHAEFDVTVAGVTQPEPHGLTLPFELPRDEAKDAWGPMVFTGTTCADLTLALRPVKRAYCRTTDRSPCPAYAISATGVVAK